MSHAECSFDPHSLLSISELCYPNNEKDVRRSLDAAVKDVNVHRVGGEITTLLLAWVNAVRHTADSLTVLLVVGHRVSFR